MSSKDFNYDVIELIDAIRERPCLWDKSIENYKDKVERRLSWEEIFSILEEKYDEMSLEDKRFVGKFLKLVARFHFITIRCLTYCCCYRQSYYSIWRAKYETLNNYGIGTYLFNSTLRSTALHCIVSVPPRS